MNGAIIGFGNIAQAHLHAYTSVSELQIRAIVDTSEARSKYAKQLYPDIKCYSSIEEMFKDEEIDFIDICTPPSTHFFYIKAGLLGKCHVLCEKPFLTEIESYSEILSLIEYSQKHIYPLHNYKFAPIVKWMKQQVNSKEFGEIKHGYFQTIRNGHAKGVAEWDKDWRRNPTISAGGILLDHGPHNIYLSSFLLEQYPIAVSCITGNLCKSENYLSTEDTAMLTLYFDNEVKFFIELSWAGCFRNTHYSIMGSNQNIIVENDKTNITKNGTFDSIEVNSDFDDPTHKNWFFEMFIDFLDLVKNPEKQQTLIQEAFNTTLIIQMAYESASKKGEIIPIARKDIKIITP